MSQSSPGPATKSNRPFLSVPKLWWAIIILILLLVVLPLVNIQMAKSKETYKYTYSKLSTTFMGPSYAGGGGQFLRPTEFKGPLQNKPSDQIVLKQTLGKDQVLAGELVLSTNFASEDSMKVYTAILKDPKNAAYSNVITNGYNKFLANAAGVNYSITSSSLQPITLKKFKGTARQAEITAIGKAKSQPSLKGNAYVLAGPHGFYYLLLDSIGYNWQPNQATWQKVIDSLSIDQ